MTKTKQTNTINPRQNELEKLSKAIKIVNGLETAFIVGAAAGAVSYVVGDAIDQDKLSAIGVGVLLYSTLFGIFAGYKKDELKETRKYFQDPEMNSHLKYKFESKDKK